MNAADVLVRGAWAILVVSVVAWPVTALTVAREEPQFVLGLSWFAIVMTAGEILLTAYVRRSQEDD